MKLQSSKSPSILLFPETSTKYCNPFLSAKNSSLSLSLSLYIFTNFAKLTIIIIIKQIWRYKKGVFVCKIMNLLKSARYFLSQPVYDTQHFPSQLSIKSQRCISQSFTIHSFLFCAPWLSPFQSRDFWIRPLHCPPSFLYSEEGNLSTLWAWQNFQIQPFCLKILLGIIDWESIFPNVQKRKKRKWQ